MLDLEKPLHLPDRDPHFVHGHMVDEPIPFHQRRPRPVENRFCCQTCLKTTILTVEQLSLPKIPSFTMSAVEANKPIRDGGRFHVSGVMFSFPPALVFSFFPFTLGFWEGAPLPIPLDIEETQGAFELPLLKPEPAFGAASKSGHFLRSSSKALNQWPFRKPGPPSASSTE